MKKITFFKTLLIAVTMLVGGGNLAWTGDVTTLYARGGNATAWSNADLADWVLSGTAVSSIETNGLKFAKTVVERSEYTYTKSISTSDGAIVSMDLAWIVESANGSATAGCYFKFGDVTLFWCGQNRDLKITIGETGTTLISSGNSNLRGTTFNVSLSINKGTKAVTYSISNTAYNSGNAIVGNGTVSSSDITSVIFGWWRGGQQNVSSQIINSISISEEAQDIVNANYTINYKLGDAIVKTVAGTSAVGATITALTAIDGEGDYADKHYLITADAAPSMTLVSNSASNVLNVPVRAPYTATLNLTYTIGGVVQAPVTEDFTETNDKVCAWNYFYPMYIESGGNYYIASDITKFGETGTFTNGEIIEKNVDYTLVNDVAVFVEAESLNTNTSKNTNYSGGSTGYVTANMGYSLGTLPAGEYKLSVYLEDRGDRGIYLKSGSYNGTEILNMGTNRNSPAGVYSKNFILTEETSLFLTGFPTNEGTGTNQCANIDYILVKPRPDYITKTITSAGYATLYSEYPLNFDGSSVKAYIAEVSGTGITFTEVREIPAYTGVLVANENGGTYYITVEATNQTYDGNAFRGVLEDTEVPAGSYVLMNGSEGVGFYKTTKTFTVGAGTAYLPGGAGARAFYAIDNESSGISSIALPEQQAEQIFNLNGQRICVPKKGLYIMDGKKVLVK